MCFLHCQYRILLKGFGVMLRLNRRVKPKNSKTLEYSDSLISRINEEGDDYTITNTAKTVPEKRANANGKPHVIIKV